MEAKRLKAKKHVDSETGCMCRFIFSETERFRPHCHEYFEIFLIIDGRVTHYVNNITQKLHEGSLVFIRPDDVHDYKYESGDKYRFVNISFSSETAEEIFGFLSSGINKELLLSSAEPPVINLDRLEAKRLYMRLQELNTVEYQNKRELKLNSRMLILNIMADYFAGFSKPVYESVPPWLEALIKKMNKKENFCMGIERMTELSGRSKEHLARSMKKFYGMTMSEFINNLRLNYAANMLCSSNMSVMDICFDSGFQNVSWFYTLFKKNFGMSPKEFKHNG